MKTELSLEHVNLLLRILRKRRKQLEAKYLNDVEVVVRTRLPKSDQAEAKRNLEADREYRIAGESLTWLVANQEFLLGLDERCG